MGLEDVFKKSISYEEADKRSLSFEETRHGMNVYGNGILYRRMEVYNDIAIIYKILCDDKATEIPVETVEV